MSNTVLEDLNPRQREAIPAPDSPLLDPHDNASFLRVVNVPVRGVVATTIGLLQGNVENRRTFLWGATAQLLGDNALPAPERYLSK